MKQLKMSLAVILFLIGLTSNVKAQTGTAAQYMQAGNTSYAAKNYDMAIQYYQAAVNLNANYGPAYQGLGNSYYFKGDNQTALKNYEKALSFDPNNASLNSFVQSLRTKVGAAPAAPAAASPAASTSTMEASSASSASKFELDINAGLGLDSSVIGFGGGLTGYIPLDKNLFLGASAAYYTFSQGESGSATGDGVTVTANASASNSFIEGLVRAKYVFDGQSMKPYFFAGAGIADLTISYSASGSAGTGESLSGSNSESQVDPMFAVGGGLAFSAGKDMDITVQLKESIILVPGVTESETVDGITESETVGGGTASYTVVEAGLDFNL